MSKTILILLFAILLTGQAFAGQTYFDPLDRKVKSLPAILQGDTDNQTAAEVTVTPAGDIAAEDVQAAVEELDGEKAAGPASSTATAVPVFGDESGKVLIETPVKIDAEGNMTGVGSVIMDGVKLTSLTVATLPATPAQGQTASISDGTDSCDCTVGGGTTTVECVYSETAWVSKICSGSVADLDDLPGDTTDDDLIDLLLIGLDRDLTELETLLDNAEYGLRLEITSDKVMTEAELIGAKYIVNQGASGEIDVTLPAVSYSISRTVIVEEDQIIELNPPAGEAFDLDGTTLTADYCVDSPAIVGSKMVVTRMRNAAGTWIWSLDEGRGDFVDTGLSD